MRFRRSGKPPAAAGWPALRSRCLPVSLARQRRLVELGVDGAWQADLAAGTASIGSRETRVELLGNAGDGPASFMFGDAVARLNAMPERLGAAAARARRAAGPDGAGVLDQDEVGYDAVDPTELAAVTSVLAGPAPMFRGPHDDGALFLALLDVTTDAPLPSPAVLTLVQEVALLGLSDVPAGIGALLAYEGFTVEPGPTLTAHRGQTTVEAFFDPQGRLSRLSSRLT